jgi:hypothetical protein
MKRIYLAVAAVVVIAAVIGLVVMLRADDAPTERASPPPAPTVAARDPGKPRLAPAPDPQPQPSGRPAIDSSIGDQRIRDHRAGEHAPTEPPTPTQPPPPQGDRPVAALVTQALSQKLQPSLQECAANLQPDAHGAKSRVEGEIRVAIKDHQATIVSAAFQLRDIADAVQEPIKQCLVQHAVGLVAPATDEADIESYAITVSMRWP